MSMPPSLKDKLHDRLAWIFPWRVKTAQGLGSFLAIVLVTLIFVAAWFTVRIRVPRLASWAAPKASVMVVAEDDGIGGAWTRRARMMGPFPSRFEPVHWEGGKGSGVEFAAQMRMIDPLYEPGFRMLPEQSSERSSLSIKGEPVMPQRHAEVVAMPQPQVVSQVPELSVLAGMAAKDLPKDLPALEMPKEQQAIAAGDWRFLIRLDAAGHVADCIPLAGAGGQGAESIGLWLRQLVFVGSSQEERWVGIAVGFRNRIVKHATDTD